MKRNTYSFDPLCLELACHFLPDSATEDAKKELAQVIQDAVEDHLLETQSNAQSTSSIRPTSGEAP